jgi:AcrR family transcriptional regulator
MLDAAEALLAERGFDEVSVAEIARRAGVTIGAFYARFPDKEALLEALEERVTEVTLATVSRATDPARWDGTTIEEALRSYCRELVDAYRETRGAGRALVLRSRHDPALKRRLGRLNTEGPPRVLEFLLAHGRIRHPDPERALRVALLAVRSTLRELILFGETWPGGAALPRDLLADELTRLFLGYLGIDGRRRLRAAPTMQER